MTHLEECVLGSILFDSSCIPKILATGISKKHFSEAADGMFRVALEMHDRHDSIDGTTLAHELVKSRVCDDLNDAALLITPCLDCVPNASHADTYARQRLEEWAEYQLQHVNEGLSGKSLIERIAKLRERLDTIDAAGRMQQSDIIRATDLIKQYPDLKPVLIDGLIRRGETANIIAPTKIGKSWLCYDLALSVATGNPWCGRFGTKKGRVLLIDNELDKETLSFRIRKVARAMGLAEIDYENSFDVWAMRGKLRDIFSIRPTINSIPHGYYALIVLDSWYRMLPAGVSENANAEMTQLSNCVDEYAEKTGAAWAPIHHSTKGDQGDKRVTDVGSGAGSMARAADSHIVLREHADAGHFVMDAAVRSFPPLESVTLRWEFPRWHVANGVAPILATRQSSRQSAKDAEGIDKIRDALSITDEDHEMWLSTSAIRKTTSMGLPRVEKLLGLMEKNGEVISKAGTYQNKDTTEYRLLKQP